MLNVISSCGSIVSRKGVQNSLKTEREMLCSSLQGLVDHLGSQIHNPPADPDVKLEIPMVLQMLHWCGKIERQVYQLQISDTCRRKDSYSNFCDPSCNIYTFSSNFN